MINARVTMLPLAFAATVMLTACGGNDAADQSAADSAAADAAAMMETPVAETFVITLSGAAERPNPVTTTAQADATIMVYPDSITYVVNGLNVNGVTAVHLHRGGAEETGPAIVVMYTSDAGADIASGSITSGTITRETALAEGVTFDQLREMVRTGAAYVNIHTTANPDGELRSQTSTGTPM